MEAVILAGGFATRLYPLTLDLAKPLIEIAGRPAIMHILDRLFLLKDHGLRRVMVVSSQRFAADFRRKLAGPFPVPVEILSNGAIRLEDKLGAVGDMAFGARRLRGDGPFWVLAGDNLFDFDPRAAAAMFHRSGERPLVITRRLARPDDTKAYNNIRVSADGTIRCFVEKPARPFARRFATCIYLFPHRIRQRLEEYLAPSDGPGNDPDKAGFFIKWLAKREPVMTLEPGGAWFDIGSLEEIDRATRHFA